MQHIICKINERKFSILSSNALLSIMDRGSKLLVVLYYRGILATKSKHFTE